MIITMKAALIGGVAVLAIAGITVGIVFATKGGDDPTCTGFTKPIDLEIKELDGKLMAIWGNPENLGDCTPKYNLTLTVNNEAQDAIQVDKNEYEIESKYNQPCVEIKIELTAIDADGVESGIQLVTYTKGIGDVSGVTTTLTPTQSESGDSYQISWDEPTGYEFCTITYQVSLNDLVKEESVNELTIDFLIADLIPCNNKVKVVPRIENVFAKAAEVTISKEVGDVSEVEVSELKEELNDNIWTISWTKPDGFDNCDVKYIVKIGEGEDQTIPDDSVTIPNADLKKCESIDVVVTPIIQENPGKGVSHQFTADVGDVSDVQVTEITPSYTEADLTWTISWTAPETYEACSPKYLLYINEIAQNEQISTTQTQILNDKLKPCESNLIQIQVAFTTANGDVFGPKADANIDGDIGNVSNVKVSNLEGTLNGDTWTISWEKPEGYDECGVEYTLKINDGDDQTVSEVTATISNEVLKKCEKNDISVTPVIQGKKGEGVTKEITADVGDVTDAKVTEITPTYNDADSTWTISWKAPETYEACSISYLLYIDGTSEETPTESITISNDKFVACEETQIDIVPKFTTATGEKEGGKESSTITGKVGNVSEVEVKELTQELSEGTWTISWTKPDGYDNCDVKFGVIIGVGGDSIENIVPGDSTTILNDDLKKCEDTEVVVTPIIQDQRGKSLSTQFKADVGNVASVQVTDLNSIYNEVDLNWVISWRGPANYEACTKTYLLYIDGNVEGAPVSEETITISNDKFIKCKDSIIEIEPIFATDDGEEPGMKAEATIQGNVGNVETVQVAELTAVLNENIWTISWTKPSDFDNCGVEYLIKIGEAAAETTSETSKTISNDDLDKCVTIDVSVTPIIQGKNGAVSTTTITTDAGDVSDARVDGITSSYDEVETVWTISWSAPVGYEACPISYLLYVGGTKEDEPVSINEAKLHNSKLIPCGDNEIQIEPIFIVNEVEVSSERTSYTMQGDVGIVSDVKVDNLNAEFNDNSWTISWDKPGSFDNCDVKYIVKIGDNDDEIIEELSKIVDTDGLKKCENVVVGVTPIIQEKNGDVSTAEISVELGVVTDVVVNDITSNYDEADSSWTISWTAPSGYEACSPTYLLYIGDTPEEESVSTPQTKISNSKLIRCEDNQIYVETIFGELKGAKTDSSIKGDVGVVDQVKISDLASSYSKDEVSWTLTWTEPTGYEACSPKYAIYINDSPHESPISGKEASIPNDVLTQCADNNIEVVPVFEIDGGVKQGEKAMETIRGTVSDVSNVQVKNVNAILNGDTWDISWEKPEDYDQCNFKYLIYLETEQVGDEVSTEETTMKNDMLTPCIVNNIGVQPRIETELGFKSVTEIRGEPPIDGRITPESFEVKSGGVLDVTWKKSEEYLSCPFDYDISIKKGEEILFEETINQENYHNTNEEIINCDDLTATVTAKLNLEEGEAVSFTCNFESALFFLRPQ